MIICVASDSHGEIENLHKAFRTAIDDFGAEIFIHLGDDYDDVKAVENDVTEIIRVPGIFSTYYKDDKLENRIIRELDGWRFLLSHTPDADAKDMPDDIDPRATAQSDKVDVLLHGHTHTPEIKLESGYIRVNPGNLKDNDKKGYPPTFCIIDAQPNTLDVKIHQLHSGGLFQSCKFTKDAITGGKR